MKISQQNEDTEKIKNKALQSRMDMRFTKIIGYRIDSCSIEKNTLVYRMWN